MLKRTQLIRFLSVFILSGLIAGQEVSIAAQEREMVTSSPIQSDFKQTICPTNLSFLQPDMEKALKFVKSASFRNVMLASLQASIPDAIIQADGLPRQIAFLKQEIIRQERKRTHAEEVARDGLRESSQPLKPCRRGKESSYCEAMDQYLISTAANLANRAFLEALQCYQEKGMR